MPPSILGVVVPATQAALGKPMKLLRFLLVLCAVLQGLTFAAAAPPVAGSADATLAAVVQVRMKALANSRTAAFLGREREGSGIVIDERGHVLTIGYIVIEADSIEIVTGDGRIVPATLAGYDHASGLGLLRPVLPLDIKPVSLGSSASVEERDPVLILPHGGREAASLAFVVSRREFSANWEYLLDSAIYTTPPSPSWSGAALIDREGKLVGVGHLLVRDAALTDSPVPGNLFVPIDLLKPILADLVARGRAPGPARPWLGLATEELSGHLLVSRVSPEGPAEAAGLRQGDIIVGVGGEAVNSLSEFYRKVWRVGGAGVEITLNVLQGLAVKSLTLRSMDRVDYLRRKASY